MKKTINEDNIIRYNRQIVLPQIDLDGQETLLNASILLIGCGGLGCAAAQYLVASGIGRITLVDDDTVSLSNLQRQILHTEQDVERLKVDSAKDTLNAINSETQILTISKRLDDASLKNQIALHDLVVDCSDNLPTRNQINRLCWSEKTPLVSGAAIRMEGQLMSVIPNKGGPCYACVSHLFGEQTLSCTESGILSPVVGIVGTSQALFAIKILCELGTDMHGKLQLFDAIDFSWRAITVPENADCSVCGEGVTYRIKQQYDARKHAK